MPKGGTRPGSGRPRTGEKQRFSMAIRPRLFETIKLQMEIERGAVVSDDEVITHIRAACYSTVEAMGSSAEKDNTESLIL